MKRSKEDAAETRRHVVAVASREFRENGLQFSVADLMSAAGLTHGGFYRHFESKEQLIGEACEEAMRSTVDNLTSGLNKNNQTLQKIIERYLAPSHKDNLAEGCPMAALGCELTRTEESTREKILAEAEKLPTQISELLDTNKYKDVKDEGYFIFSTMMGALTMARMMTDSRAANAYLRKTATRLTNQYCGHSLDESSS